MGKPDLPLAGSCRCGRVAIEVSAPPLLTMACHCTGCQKMSSSAYSLSVAIPVEGFRVTAGEPVIGGLHGTARHHFCGWCMSWMFTRMDGMPFVNVRPTMLDDTGWFVPFVETFTSEALPWARLPARHSFEGCPPLELYERLIAEYAAAA
jgi:hypothetical protein